MPSAALIRLLVAFALPALSTALQALVNSPCASYCGNVLSSTVSDEIACQDTDYGATLTASTFKACVGCQLTSTYVDPETQQTDLQWGLYNLRYATSYCLFGYPNNTNIGDSPCVTATSCGSLQKSIEYESLASNVSAFDYCNSFTTQYLPGCHTCLSIGSNELIISNFFTALEAGCEQLPAAGSTISLNGTVFSTVPVSITQPSAPPGRSDIQKPGGLSLGELIGIIAAGVVVILVVAGFCIIWKGRRRRRRILAQIQERSGYTEWKKNNHDSFIAASPGGDKLSLAQAARAGNISAGGFFDSPMSQRPLHTWGATPGMRGENDTPVSAVSGLGEKTYFSPYTSQYTTPVEKFDQNPSNREWPVDRKTSLKRMGSQGSTPLLSRSRSMEKKDPAYEMQNFSPPQTFAPQQTYSPEQIYAPQQVYSPQQTYPPPPPRKQTYSPPTVAPPGPAPMLKHPGSGRSSRNNSSSSNVSAISDADHEGTQGTAEYQRGQAF